MNNPPESRRLLWVTPKCPLPITDGARVATANLIRGLAQAGHRLHLVTLATDDESKAIADIQTTLPVASVDVVMRPGGNSGSGGKRVTDLAGTMLREPWTPLTMVNFTTATVRGGMQSVIARYRGQVDAIVYDGLHGAAHASRLGVFCGDFGIPIIYRAHNAEWLIWERRAKKAPLWARIPLYFQTVLVRRFEKSLVKGCAAVATVSEDDARLFRDLCPHTRASVVPIGYSFDRPAVAYGTSNRDIPLLFVGRLDWPPNREGLAWFLDHVWPQAYAARPELSLAIVGSGDRSWLTARGPIPGITILGHVPDVAQSYQQCMATITPIFYGGGTRVKVIEAASFQRAVISTLLGVEGLGLRPETDYLRGETAAEWIQLLTSLRPEELQERGLQGYQRLKATFAIDAAASAFTKLLACDVKL